MDVDVKNNKGPVIDLSIESSGEEKESAAIVSVSLTPTKLSFARHEASQKEGASFLEI